jgi:predicted DNA-binding protein
MIKKQTATVSLEIEQIQKLNEISKKTRIPKSVLVREAVDKVLEQYETQLKLFEEPQEKGL